MSCVCRECDRGERCVYERLHEAESSLEIMARQILAFGEENDYTQFPWWGIVRKVGFGRHEIVAGPFFSRQQAEQQRNARIHEYGDKSLTYCFSGHDSHPFRDLQAHARTVLSGGSR